MPLWQLSRVTRFSCHAGTSNQNAQSHRVCRRPASRSLAYAAGGGHKAKAAAMALVMKSECAASASEGVARLVEEARRARNGGPMATVPEPEAKPAPEPEPADELNGGLAV